MIRLALGRQNQSTVFNNATLDLSTQVYVDDLRKLVLVGENTSQVIGQVCAVSTLHSRFRHPIGVWQNMENQQTQHHTCGKGSCVRKRRVRNGRAVLPGSLATVTRYFKVAMHTDGYHHVEATKRLQHMREAWIAIR